VGTSQLTVDAAVYPHGTVLVQTVQVATGRFSRPRWTVVEDRTGQEKPPIDFYRVSADDARDYTVRMTPASQTEPRQTLASADVLLSWSTDLYLRAHVPEAKDNHWVTDYPHDYCTAGTRGYTRRLTAEQMEALKPPTPTTLPAMAATPPSPPHTDTRAPRTSPLAAENIKAVTSRVQNDLMTAAVNAADDTATRYLLLGV
jgi:hypothetical protein